MKEAISINPRWCDPAVNNKEENLQQLMWKDFKEKASWRENKKKRKFIVFIIYSCFLNDVTDLCTYFNVNEQKKVWKKTSQMDNLCRKTGQSQGERVQQGKRGPSFFSSLFNATVHFTSLHVTKPFQMTDPCQTTCTVYAFHLSLLILFHCNKHTRYYLWGYCMHFIHSHQNESSRG